MCSPIASAQCSVAPALHATIHHALLLSANMLHLGLLFRGTVPLLACLCVACTAFIPMPTRFPSPRGQQAATAARQSTTIAGPGSPTQQATAPTVGTRRRAVSISCYGEGSGGEGVEVAVDSAAAPGGADASAAEVDPFRPTKASMSPLVINALVSVLFKPVRSYDRARSIRTTVV